MNCVISNLSKSYPSGFRLGPIDLTIKQGEIIGLLGRNGAGKTTLIRLLLGVLRSDTGSSCLQGLKAKEPVLTKRQIGYLDEEPVHYDWMKIKWLARFCSSYYPDWDNNLFHSYLHSYSLNQASRVGQLSKGSRVRLGIAMALAHRPLLLLLDEPTSGLDPFVRVQVLDAIVDYVQTNSEASVLLSSHITSDLEKICTRAVILDRGRLLSDTQIERWTKDGNPARHVSWLEEKLLQTVPSNSIH